MLEFFVSRENAVAAEADLLVCVVRSVKKQGTFKEINQATDGVLSQIAKNADFKGQKEEQLATPIWSGLAAKQLLLLGVGEESLETRELWVKLSAKAARHANRNQAKSIAWALPKNQLSTIAVSGISLGVQLASYTFLEHKSSDAKPSSLVETTFLLPERAATALEDECGYAIQDAVVMAESICAARDLVNAPPNYLTPETFSDYAAEMAEEYGLECTILNEQELDERGFNLLLAVGHGSIQESRLAHIVYRPEGYKKKTRLFLVGKGVTFDSGGLSLKPSASMLNMHADMAGAAAVFGAMQAIAQLEPNIEVHGILAMTENMTGSSAYKLNDVITGYGGKTVEIRNTDAEGRLALADALAYASEHKATHIIDVATLTGACLVALGKETAAVMSNSPKMAKRVLKASENVGESMWELPLLESLRAGLKSNIADLGNIGGRYGGAISAALFLQAFVGDDIQWTHLDIAGPSFADKDQGAITKGGTGFAVATLAEYAQLLA